MLPGIVSAFKRMQNIIAREPVGGEPDLSRMTDSAEKTLAYDYMWVKGMLGRAIARHDYRAALLVLADVTPDIDSFFADVHVMADKENRIALLRAMRDQFARVAWFSGIRS